LTKTTTQDFGKEVFPGVDPHAKVQVHLFDGYWEDIGTIGSFFEANLQLAQPNPPFDMMSVEIRRFLPARVRLAPTRVGGATVKNSLIADGCQIEDGAVIENSVIGCELSRSARTCRFATRSSWARLLPRSRTDIAADLGPRRAAAGHRRRHGDRPGHRRQERAASAATCGSSTPKALKDRADDGIGRHLRRHHSCVVKEAVLNDGWRLM
jgi:hypothetical protein